MRTPSKIIKNPIICKGWNVCQSNPREIAHTKIDRPVSITSRWTADSFRVTPIPANEVKTRHNVVPKIK